MGSHFAPALCGLVAAFQEYCFRKAFHGMRTHHKLLHNSRYVDNRVLLHFPGWRDNYPWTHFTKLDFYEAPILLEEVDDTEILGCTISTTQRTITVRQPKDLVSLRSGLSEDSDLAVISAFRARALLIIRYTFPIPLVFDQLTDLIAIFGLKSVTPCRTTSMHTTHTLEILQTKNSTNSNKHPKVWSSHADDFRRFNQTGTIGLVAQTRKRPALDADTWLGLSQVPHFPTWQGLSQEPHLFSKSCLVLIVLLLDPVS